MTGSPDQIRRLAWLGDRALALALVQMLDEHPDRSLADKARAASLLTSNRILAQVAEHLQLPAWVPGSFGVRKLATVLEALVGAVLLDGGAAAVRSCVEDLYAPLIDQLGEQLWQRDAKSALKERYEKPGQAGPQYQIATNSPGAYEVVCKIGTLSSHGAAATLRGAKLAAARRMLDRLESGAPE